MDTRFVEQQRKFDEVMKNAAIMKHRNAALIWQVKSADLECKLRKYITDIMSKQEVK